MNEYEIELNYRMISRPYKKWGNMTGKTRQSNVSAVKDRDGHMVYGPRYYGHDATSLDPLDGLRATFARIDAAQKNQSR